MAVLTDDKQRRVAGEETKILVELTGADSTTFYAGALIGVNSSGRAVNASDAASVFILGVCRERLVTGASNTLPVKCERGHLEWLPINSTNITAASIGRNACVFDNNMITNAATATNDMVIGTVVSLETVGGVSGAFVHVGVFAPTNA